MESAEAMIAHIQGLSSTPEDLAHLHNLLKQSEDSLESQAPNLGPLLTQLDPSKHSLGYLYILEACASATWGEQENELVSTIAKFIDSCVTEQIRLAPEKFVSVCRKLKDETMQLQMPIRGVAPLRTAVRKLQPTSEHLTTLHPDFLVLCLLAKCYKAGLSILEDDIVEVEQPRDLFLYCYYGGMICIGLKRFRKALELLYYVITSPMSSMNAIAVESYKKYILVSLIHNGQFSNFPKYTSSVISRNQKNFCQYYNELATSYASGKISELQACLETYREKFETDNNVGLVKQVVSSLYKRNIQRLTQMYLTLSLQDIANTVQLNTTKEAEMHVLQMIQDGEIFATINQKDGMVSFHEDPEQYKSCEMIEHIDSSIQRIMALSRKVTAMDEQISSDPIYLAKIGRERQRFDLEDFDTVPQKFHM
ncbi:hypothetical protein Scep_021034 [Stephania cephalantha]|uniref:COP9 signalosome complex subunit 3 n=1 Tax=Stephania cephalantha TaxID=152367 RepID=A0AAP0I175_9MAGN